MQAAAYDVGLSPGSPGPFESIQPLAQAISQYRRRWRADLDTATGARTSVRSERRMWAELGRVAGVTSYRALLRTEVRAPARWWCQNALRRWLTSPSVRRYSPANTRIDSHVREMDN